MDKSSLILRSIWCYPPITEGMISRGDCFKKQRQASQDFFRLKNFVCGWLRAAEGLGGGLFMTKLLGNSSSGNAEEVWTTESQGHLIL